MEQALSRASARSTVQQSLVAGSLASLLSSAVLAWAGRREDRSAAAPLNALSRWYWGDEAPHCQ